MDKRILNLSIDIRAAIKFLKEHEASGSRTIPYSWFVQFTMPRIQNKSEVIPKLKACAELRAEWNISELNKRPGISRQTFYNWDSHVYLVHTPKGKLDLRKTLQFWDEIKSYI